MTKAEALLTGLGKIREGLELVGQAAGRDKLLQLLVGSEVTVKRFREAIMGEPLLRNLVYTLTAARVSRLGQESVNQVLDRFFEVLTDLAKPYGQPAQSQSADAPAAQGKGE